MKNRLIVFFAVLAFCVAAILPLSGCAQGDSFASSSNTLPALGDPGPGSAPLHFCFGGNTYIFSGHCVDTLPEGFEFVREVNNDSLSLGDPAVDFSGNAAGYIYMSESDKTAAYFRFKNRNEAVDGKEQYLKMELQK